MIPYCTLFLWFFCARVSYGAGPGNTDALDTVGWSSDPNGRGTFTLVSSCVLTLIICVYSAMHLNVPPHGESTLRFWMRNIRWGFWGIFGPELVVFIAWKQYVSAKAIEKGSRNEFETKGSLLQVEMIPKPSAVCLSAPIIPMPGVLTTGSGTCRTPFVSPCSPLFLDGSSWIFCGDGRLYFSHEQPYHGPDEANLWL